MRISLNFIKFRNYNLSREYIESDFNYNNIDITNDLNITEFKNNTDETNDNIHRIFNYLLSELNDVYDKLIEYIKEYQGQFN